MTFQSCSEDEACEVGYEGKDCDVEIRSYMIGTYNATDVDVNSGETFTYAPAISKNSQSVTVINIAKFGDFYTGAEIVTSNVTKSGNTINFTIPTQRPDNEYTVQGQGTFDVNTKKITLQYSLTDASGATLNYTGNWGLQ